MNLKCITILFVVGPLIGLGGCAQKTHISKSPNHNTYQYIANINFTEQVSGSNNHEDIDSNNKDRAAILAMQGEYKVDFDFKETVVLDSDYERFPPKKTGAFETVVVLESTPNHIVLQHLLVVGDNHVVKHWRQDWTFEATHRFEFTEDQTWTINPIAKEQQKGFWTQCVYEVSDAPRYCGTGKWDHTQYASTWTSDGTWRPLPRRDYTIRDDYNALYVENRHTITPIGWTHEQDNAKVIRSGEEVQKILVREFGFNDYRNISGYNFTPAYDYWEKTSPYWSMVRTAWLKYFHDENRIVLNTDIDGMPIIEATFEHARAIENGELIPGMDSIEKIFTQWVNVPVDQKSVSLLSK